MPGVDQNNGVIGPADNENKISVAHRVCLADDVWQAMKVQLRYAKDIDDPFALDDLSDIVFYSLDVAHPLDEADLAKTVKAPHKVTFLNTESRTILNTEHQVEDVAVQIADSAVYIDKELPLMKQLEDNNFKEYG